MKDYHFPAAVTIPAAIGLVGVLWLLRRKSDSNEERKRKAKVVPNEEESTRNAEAEQQIKHIETAREPVSQGRSPESHCCERSGSKLMFEARGISCQAAPILEELDVSSDEKVEFGHQIDGAGVQWAESGIFGSGDINSCGESGIFGSADITPCGESDFLGSVDINPCGEDGISGSGDNISCDKSGFLGSADINPCGESGIFGSGDIDSYGESGILGLGDIDSYGESGIFGSADIDSCDESSITQDSLYDCQKSIFSNDCHVGGLESFNHDCSHRGCLNSSQTEYIEQQVMTALNDGLVEAQVFMFQPGSVGKSLFQVGENQQDVCSLSSIVGLGVEEEVALIDKTHDSQLESSVDLYQSDGTDKVNRHPTCNLPTDVVGDMESLPYLGGIGVDFGVVATSSDDRSRNLAALQDLAELQLISCSNATPLNLSLVTERQLGMVTKRLPGMVTECQPGMVTECQPGMVTESQPGMVTESQPDMVMESQPSMVTERQLCMVTERQPGMVDIFSVGTTNTSTVKPTDGSTVKPTDGSTVKPTERTLIEPTDSSPIEPTDISSGEPTDSSPIEPTDLSRVEPTDISPIEPTDNSPIEPTDLSPVESTDISPIEPTDSSLVEPTDISLVEPTISSPVEPTISFPVEPTISSPISSPVEPADSCLVRTTASFSFGATARFSNKSSDSSSVGTTDDSLVGTTDSPLVGATDSPLVGATDSPLVGATDSPLVGATDSPLVGATDSPLVGATDSPLVGTTDSPLIGTTDSPLVGTIDSPLVGTSDSPLVGTIDSPLVRTIDSPLVGTTDISMKPLVSSVSTVTVNTAPKIDRHSVSSIKSLSSEKDETRPSSARWLPKASSSSIDSFGPDEIEAIWGLGSSMDYLDKELFFMDTDPVVIPSRPNGLLDGATDLSFKQEDEEPLAALLQAEDQTNVDDSFRDTIFQSSGATTQAFPEKSLNAESLPQSTSPMGDNSSEGSNDSGRGGSDHDMVLPGGDALIHFDFNMPSEICGQFIGKHGKNINFLKIKTGAHVALTNSCSTPGFQVCQVSGTQAEVDDALSMIRQKFPLQDYPLLTMVPISIPVPVPLQPDSQIVFPEVMQLSLPEGVSVDVFVSAVVDAGQVFVQQPTHRSFMSLEKLNYFLNLVYTQDPDVPNVPLPIESDVICVCESEGFWYRAMTMSLEDENGDVQVKFVDYGGYMTLPVSALKQIRADFMNLPFQAVECFMANITPNQGQKLFSNDATQALCDLTQGKLLQCQVVARTEYGLPYVHLYQVNSQSRSAVLINQALVNSRLVRWIEIL